MGDKISLGQEVEYKSQYSTESLFAINREERRKGYVPMFGGDVWTAYEFSFLLPNGLPQYKVIRIFNPCDSVNIFESKGLKLYLNSFNNTVFKDLETALSTVRRDLTQLTGKSIEVEEVKSFLEDRVSDFILLESIPIERVDTYVYDPSLLKVEEIPTVEHVISNLLRSNCEITNQPDWARVSITYRGSRCVTRDSLLKYIVSYRNHQEFHEPTCERIYQDLFKVLQPEYLTVICQYTRRGGIDISPIRSSHPIEKDMRNLSKLLQQ